ncbi:acyl-peptide hydrolase, partial [mine drainage metagenome]
MDGGAIVAVSSRAGFDVMSVIHAGSSAVLALPYTHLAGVVSRGDGVVAVAGSPLRATGIVSLDLPSGRVTTLKSSQKAVVDESYLAEPEPIDFRTEGSLVAHGLYYPPKNPDYVAPAGELPPLIVSSHGGPTSAAAVSLNYAIQYWTSRGIGVVDVNYGGSSGYGREYRRRLRGRVGHRRPRRLRERGQVS